MSGAVKVSRFEFTEGSGWFELLALLQLSSETRDVSQLSPNPPPTLLAFSPPWGRVGRVLESPPATIALGKQAEEGVQGSSCSHSGQGG